MPFPSVCKGKESLDAASPDSKSTASASTTSTAGKVGGTSLICLGRYPFSGHSCVWVHETKWVSRQHHSSMPLAAGVPTQCSYPFQAPSGRKTPMDRSASLGQRAVQDSFRVSLTRKKVCCKLL